MSGGYATIPSPPATWAWRRGERDGERVEGTLTLETAEGVVLELEPA